MAINKVLAAVDDTDGGRKALELAAEVCEGNPNAHIDAVYVVPIPLLDDAQMENFRAILDLMLEDGKKLLSDAIDGLGPEAGERVSALLITGTNPANELIKLADKGSYDLVVIGSRGFSGVKEYLGSVSHKVLHGASAPVLIAK